MFWKNDADDKCSVKVLECLSTTNSSGCPGKEGKCCTVVVVIVCSVLED